MQGFITNEDDRENLRFLINASNETIKEWYKTCTDDDIEYAQELMNAFALELQEAANENRIEFELLTMCEYSDAISVIETIKEK